MDIKSVLFWSAALFALLQFGLLPRMKHAWSRLPLDKQLKRFGVLAILEKVREYSLITAMCLLTFGLVVFFSSSYSGDSSAAISHALLRAQAANEKLKHLKEFWATWIFFISFLLLWAAWYRSAKKLARETLTAIRRTEYERLAKERDEHPENRKDLPPTSEMDLVWGEIESVMREVQSGRLTPDARERKLQYVRKLSAVWTFMDFDRRLEVRWDTEPVGGTSAVAGVKRFFSSRGFLSDMKGIGKLLSYASTALLTLSMVGFAAKSADESISNRVAKLSVNIAPWTQLNFDGLGNVSGYTATQGSLAVAANGWDPGGTGLTEVTAIMGFY